MISPLTRRRFLGFLASLPIVGRFVPKPSSLGVDMASGESFSAAAGWVRLGINVPEWHTYRFSYLPMTETEKKQLIAKMKKAWDALEKNPPLTAADPESPPPSAG